MRKKLLTVAIVEGLVLACALYGHVVLHYATWCQWAEPGLWELSHALCDAQVWLAVAQYMAVSTAFLLAWVVWPWPGHKLSYILLAWGITWLPMAIGCTEDCTRLPHGPMNMPLCLFAFPFFALLCVMEAVLIGVFVKVPPEDCYEGTLIS